MAEKPYVPALFLSGHCNPGNPPTLHANCRVVCTPRPGTHPDVTTRCICPTCEHDRCVESVTVKGASPDGSDWTIRCRLPYDHEVLLKHRQNPPGVAGVVW